ncbi:Spore germination protein YndF [Trichinella spiralis]|uniref:Spore germination protein YndF n=1 Tax=Trichinella spiralis TaxID=6334 RepID=A0ABR3KDH3_TRISP
MHEQETTDESSAELMSSKLRKKLLLFVIAKVWLFICIVGCWHCAKLRSVTPVAADVDLSSEVHHQSRIAYIGIGFERWVNRMQEKANQLFPVTLTQYMMC